MKFRNLFGNRADNDGGELANMTEKIIIKSDKIMKMGLATSMDFDRVRDMDSDDFEMMRDCSALWNDSKDYVMKTANLLDQIPEIKKEQETIKRQLEEIQALLRMIASKREA